MGGEEANTYNETHMLIVKNVRKELNFSFKKKIIEFSTIFRNNTNQYEITWINIGF